MATKMSLEYFGMPGCGATVKEAKLDAGRKIEAALTGTYQPSIINWRGRTAIVYRDATNGWCYGTMDTTEGVKQSYSTCHPSNNDDRLGVELSARKHLAQNGQQYGERTCELFAAVGGRMTRELEQAEREFAEYGTWQDAYRDAINAGKTDMEARDEANMVRYRRAA